MASTYQNQSRHQSGSLLDCPCSPFDFQASFISFPPSAPRACDVIESSSGSCTYHIAKTGNEQLAESMGYRIKSIGVREAQLIVADALTCIEKLTNTQLTRRPRDLPPGQVLAKLQSVVPRQCFRSTVGNVHAYKDGDSHCTQSVVASAAAKYIQTLRSHDYNKRGVKAHTKHVIDKPATTLVVQAKTYPENAAVEMALERLKAWCDDWLDGKTADTDWDKMEELV